MIGVLSESIMISMKDTRFLEDLARNATQYSALMKGNTSSSCPTRLDSDDDSIEFM
jgi:hypothetical protein